MLTRPSIYVTLFILSKDKVYKDIEAEILPKIKDILRTKPSLRFAKKKFSFKIRLSSRNFTQLYATLRKIYAKFFIQN